VPARAGTAPHSAGTVPEQTLPRHYSDRVTDRELARRNTNWTVRWISLVVAFVGLLFLWVSGWSLLTNQTQLQAFISQIGGLLLATGLVTFVWQQWGQRNFANELMAMANLSTDLERSGIKRVTDQYLADVEWSDLFRDATKVDIVVAYASTWRNANRDRLQQVAKDPHARIRVFLPDPTDDRTLDNLTQRFSTDRALLRGKIEEAITDFQHLAVPGGADLKVYLRKGDVVFSCYRFGTQAVLTMYSHSRERQTHVPTFVVRGGDLFTFVYDEIRALLKQSYEAP
jgi:hypothetical protein